jgi:hypothetical protein
MGNRNIRSANVPGGAQAESGTRAGEHSADQMRALNFELIFLLGREVADGDEYLVDGL